MNQITPARANDIIIAKPFLLDFYTTTPYQWAISNGYEGTKAEFIFQWLSALNGFTNSNIQDHIVDETIHHTIEELNEVYELLSNKKTNLTDNSDVFYPTQKAVNTALDFKIDKLAIINTIQNDSNKVLSEQFISSLIIDTTKNLFNYLDIIIGYYIGNSGGIVTNITKDIVEGRSAISNYIAVSENTTYTLSRWADNDASVIFFNSNKEKISGIYCGYASNVPTTFTTPAGCAYVVFSIATIYVADINVYKLVQLEVGNSATDFIPAFKAKDSFLTEYLKKVELGDNVPILRKVIGKNLFDESQIINGKYIQTTTGVLSNNALSKISGLIPIIAGNTYYLYRTGSGNNSSEGRFVAIDGVTSLKPINPATNLDYANYALGTNAAVKAPVDAAYFQFTCMVTSVTFISGKVQFELGDSYSGYEAYNERLEVSYNNLPKELESINTRVSNIEVSSSIDTITIANSDKIGYFSNSFLNGYCMKGKHPLNYLGMFDDRIHYNFGISGYDVLESLNKINRNETCLGVIPVQNWGIQYGVIAMYENDGALSAADKETYYQNVKKYCEALEAMGATPILSTEHTWSARCTYLQRLSKEKGYMLMDWGKWANPYNSNRFAPFWYNGHPSTRTHWLWTNGMKKFEDTLPRLRKGLKLFRARSTYSNISELIYDDYVSRAELFNEINCGAATLTPATEKYVDRIAVGVTLFENTNDEYQAIQAKNAVNFGSTCLLEVITPYERNNIRMLDIQLASTGITNAYIKKINSLSNPLPDTRYIAFGIIEGADLLTPNTSFNITGGVFNNSILGTYIVEGVVNGFIVTKTSSSGKITSGTDNPICDISGVTLVGSYDYPTADYMNRFNKPLGEWVEVSIVNNIISISKTLLNTCMQYDKASLLFIGSNINISDIQCNVAGDVTKQLMSKQLSIKRAGTSLITANLFDNDKTEWINLASTTKYTPVISTLDGISEEQLPIGITTVRNITAGQILSQSLSTITGFPSLQIRFLARYFPKFIDTDAAFSTSELFQGSIDYAKANIYIGNSLTDKDKIAEVIIGAFWNEYVIDFDYIRGNQIFIECGSKHFHIAKFEIEKIA